MEKFGEYLITSGLVLNEDVHFISFHGCYDFAYLIKILTNLPLPDSESKFFELLKIYFPHYYDIRYLVRLYDHYRGSLQKLANELDVSRIGTQHQAGSDSIITKDVFFNLKFSANVDILFKDEKNILFGFESGNIHNNGNIYNNGGNEDNSEHNVNFNHYVNNNFNNYPKNNSNNQFFPMNQVNYQFVNFRNNQFNPINSNANSNMVNNMNVFR